MRRLLAAAALALAGAASAAVPQRINYQGKLANAAGDPVNGTHSFRFKLFAAETGGAALFSEDVAVGNAINVVNGIYSVQIGSFTAGGIPYGVFDNEHLYLEIDVAAGISLASAETLAPRERLNAAAWAVHALGAERLGTGAVIATFTSTGNLQLVAGSTVTSNGTLTFSTAPSAGQVGRPHIFLDRDGDVGFGTSAPQYRLDVEGSDTGVDGHTFAVRNTNNSAGAAASMKLITAGASAGDPFAHFTVTGVTDWTMGIQNNDSDKFKITPYFTLGEAPGLTLDISGRLGVSTGTPQGTLDVAGSAHFGPLANKSTFTAAPNASTYALYASSGISIATGPLTLNAGGFIRFTDGSTMRSASFASAQQTAFSSLTVIDTNIGPTGDAYSFAVTTAADRGIYHLHVATNGTVSVGQPAFQVAGATFVVVAAGAAAGASAPGFIGNNLSLAGRTIQVFHNQQNANISIRSAAVPGIWQENGLGFANRRLWTQQVILNSQVWRNFNENTGAINQDHILVLTSSGNVGVGIGDPRARLHVSSNTTATTDNIVLVSTTNGTTTTNLFRVQANGNVFAAGAFTGGGADLAEMYPAEPGVEAGDVVELAPDGRLRLASASSRRVMGVISTRPGTLLGWDIDRTEMPGHRPLALAGRVPVRFSPENGPVRRGDALAASSTPGASRRAGPGEPAVAVALEDREAEGLVLGYVRGADPASRSELDALREENRALRRDLDELRRAVLAPKGGER